MPAKKQDKVRVACPQCGNLQLEPASAYSTICKKCHAHFLVQEVRAPVTKAKPAAKTRLPVIEQKQVICFQCGTTLEAPATAESTMCKRCSAHVDLRDYTIAHAESKNFRTHGRFVIEEKGYLFNTEAMVGTAIIKGKFLGKLNAVNSLTIYSTANIKGSFTTGRLIIPEGNYFRWPEIKCGGAEIGGELVGKLMAEGTVLLKSTARFFGDIAARGLVVESGAVVVGAMKIGGVM
ncbi:MAG: polymer-forming cytoskeletal protein [Verrucomicrobia bacterium]|nr:polymer-forming cytoskeletal protein [Verrucomicrobiota bacterium]